MSGKSAKKIASAHGKRHAPRHTSPNTAEKGATRPSNGSTPKKPRTPAPKTSGPAGGRKPPASATGLSLEERLLAYLAEHGRAVFGAELFKSLNASRDELMVYLGEQKDLRANGGTPAIDLADGVITLARTKPLDLDELVAALEKRSDLVSDADLAKGLGTKVKAVRDVAFGPAGRARIEAHPGEKGAWLFKLKRGGAAFVPVAQTPASTKKFLDGVLPAKAQKTLKARLVTGVECAKMGISDQPTGGIALTVGKIAFVVAVDANGDYRTQAPTGAEVLFVPPGFDKYRAASARDPLIVVDDVLDALALDAQGLAAVALHPSCKTLDDVPKERRTILGGPTLLLGPWPGDLRAQAIRMTQVAMLLEKGVAAVVDWTLGPDATRTRVARLVRSDEKALRALLLKAVPADPVRRLDSTPKDRRILLIKDAAFMVSIVERDARLGVRRLFKGEGVGEFDREVRPYQRNKRGAADGADPKRVQELYEALGASRICVHTSEPPVVVVTSSVTDRVVQFELSDPRRSFFDYDYVRTQMSSAGFGQVPALLEVRKEEWYEAACLLMANAEHVETPEESSKTRRLKEALKDVILDMPPIQPSEEFGGLEESEARASLRSAMKRGRCYVDGKGRRTFHADGVASKLRQCSGDLQKTSYETILYVLGGLGCVHKKNGGWIPITGMGPKSGLTLKGVWEVEREALNEVGENEEGEDATT